MRAGGRTPALAANAPLREARNAVYGAFFGNGLLFASWASRIPQVRTELGVTPGVLGLVLLCGSAGSALGTLVSGLITGRLGEIRTVAVMSLAAAAGMAAAAIGCRVSIALVAGGLALFGFGSGNWDVAMNVQGAAVERTMGRAVMPRFHAGWSIGTVAGAGVGAAMVALRVPVTVHLVVVSLAVAAAVPVAARSFLPATHAAARAGGPAARLRVLAAWSDPRTLLIGLFVLCMAFTEGTGNDWLSLGIIDGYHAPAAVGTAALAVFLAAMTTGRWWGPRLIDSYGRVRVLRACAAVALAGLLLIEFGRVMPVALAGAVLMGLGTSLGFPVGLSSAADDPRHAPARVSTAASIGYLAFLAGPPVIGFLGDRVGVLRSLAVTCAMLAAALILCRATAPIGPPATAAPPASPAQPGPRHPAGDQPRVPGT